MLSTLLTWHLVVTAALLAAYALVAGLQWSSARLTGLRRRSADRRSALLPAARREADASPAAVAMSTAA